MGTTPFEAAGEPRVVLRVTLPNALDQPPLMLAVRGVPPDDLAGWVSRHEDTITPSAAASSPPDAEIRVRAGARRSRSKNPATAAVDHPVRLLSVRPAVVAAARQAGLALACYTVDDPVEAARLFAAGVDAVFTDRPDRVWVDEGP